MYGAIINVYTSHRSFRRSGRARVSAEVNVNDNVEPRLVLDCVHSLSLHFVSLQVRPTVAHATAFGSNYMQMNCPLLFIPRHKWFFPKFDHFGLLSLSLCFVIWPFTSRRLKPQIPVPVRGIKLSDMKGKDWRQNNLFEEKLCIRGGEEGVSSTPFIKFSQKKLSNVTQSCSVPRNSFGATQLF